MNERKILLFIFFVFIYCLYSVQMWFMTNSIPDEELQRQKSRARAEIQPPVAPLDLNNTQQTKDVKKVRTKFIPLYIKNSCSALEVFTQKPVIENREIKEHKEIKPKQMEPENNTITVIGITVFLVILVLNAAIDVIKVKEEEKARRKLNPDGERRQSLAEFANKKTLRRESSKFGLQLFQIAESMMSPNEEKKTREARPYTRGDSINSYLSDKKAPTENSAPPSIGETASAEPRLVKRQSVAKLFGARPAPMVRRSSYPALPLNPEIQALMLGSRQSSFDSDDEDGKGRRVRIIRRY